MPRGRPRTGTGTTPAKRAMGTAGRQGMPISHNPEPTISLANDAVSTKENLPPGYDQFSLTDEFTVDREARQELGINDNEDVCWIRDDRYWGAKVPGNRFMQFRRENPGGRMILQDGVPFSNGFDLVLCARPKSEVEKLRKRETQELKDYLKTHDPLNPEQEQQHEDDFDRDNRAEVRRKMRENSQLALRGGMIGTHSPTSGLSYDEALDRLRVTPSMIEAEEAKWARGPRHVNVSEQEAIDAGRASQPRETGSGKFISIPQNVKPKNLAKAG